MDDPGNDVAPRTATVVSGDDTPRGPSPALVLNEALVGLDAARLLPRAVQVLRRRRAVVPRDVLVVPGWLAGDRSTVVLRRTLARDGHRVRGWERGANRGDIDVNITAITAVVRRRADAIGRPIDLVGWSLGGVVAREVAKRVPTAVRRIITMGTPLHGPAGTLFEPFFEPPGQRRAPPPVPTTVIWSRRDGVVTWEAQLDDGNPWAEHVEVSSRHLGMGVDPAVLTVVRDRVAAPATTPLSAATSGTPTP